jgi:hypothetical protein
MPRRCSGPSGPPACGPTGPELLRQSAGTARRPRPPPSWRLPLSLLRCTRAVPAALPGCHQAWRHLGHCPPWLPRRWQRRGQLLLVSAVCSALGGSLPAAAVPAARARGLRCATPGSRPQAAEAAGQTSLGPLQEPQQPSAAAAAAGYQLLWLPKSAVMPGPASCGLQARYDDDVQLGV